MSEIDTGKILTELAKDLAKSIVEAIYSVGSSQYKKALVSLELCFKKYASRSFDKYS